MPLTPSLIRCLLAVLALWENEPPVASKDVAHLLGVKKPTIHRTLEALREKGLVDKELYGDVRLTPLGLAQAKALETQRDDLTLLFSRRFRLPPDESVRAALALMGALAPESLRQLQEARGM